MSDECERSAKAAVSLEDAARELMDAALLLAAYAESIGRLGHGQKDTTLRLAANVNVKADALRTVLPTNHAPELR